MARRSEGKLTPKPVYNILGAVMIEKPIVRVNKVLTDFMRGERSLVFVSKQT